MPGPVDGLDTLVAAYQALGIDVRASKRAIRHRYLELARQHHPDKWPNGSPRQAEAATRMREINAAYDLIASAPLRDHVFVSESTISVDESTASVDKSSTQGAWSRPVSALVETVVRFALGAVVGGVIAFRLHSWGVPGTTVFAIALPLFFAFAFTSTSNRTSRMRDSWSWW